MQFDIGRLRRPEWLMGGGAVALFIFTFLFKWFGSSVSGSGFSFSSSLDGWNSVTNTRWLLLLTIAAGLTLAVTVAGQRELQLPMSLSTIVGALAALSAIFVLYRIIDHPHGGQTVTGFQTGVVSFKYGAKLGLYLAFIATLVMTYGAYLGMQREGTSLTDVRDQASRAMSSAAAAASSATASSSSSSGESGGGGASAPPPGTETPSAVDGEPPLPPPAS